MALAEANSVAPDRHRPTLFSWRGATQRLHAWRKDESDRSVAQRTAGTAFLIRVASAAIIYLTQVVLARWMGRFEFGIYVYVWAWVGFLGMLAVGGLAPAAQRFIPEYRALGDIPRLRGFLLGSRWISFGYGLAVTAVFVGAMLVLRDKIPVYFWLPLLAGAAAIPIFPVASTQDTIGRCFQWIELALVPAFVIHPLVIAAGLVAIHTITGSVSALEGLAVAAASYWTLALIQMAILHRRLGRAVEAGPRQFDCAMWMKTAFPIAFVDGFFLMLTYVDVLILQFFVGPQDIAVYYAATKTLALVNFIYFAVSAAAAHRFAHYHVAGETDRLKSFLRDTIRWTFWPSLALTVALLTVGQPVLDLFGPGFSQGYPLMFVLAIGLLCRASVGPAERLLSMQGESSACAIIYACAFATNLVMCLFLIPHFGLNGAACATAGAMVVESVLLFVYSRRRLGLHVFILGGPRVTVPAETGRN